jgi:uncharacterized protein
MHTLDQAAEDFLNCARMAVAGVSRKGDTAANIIYRRLRKEGYDVFPVNPKGGPIEGDRAFTTIASIPGGVEAVVVATPPEASVDVVSQAADAGATMLWFHRSLGQGSVSVEAVDLARTLGMRVIVGGCPMMHLDPVDVVHRCGKWVLGVTGKKGRPEGFAADVTA